MQKGSGQRILHPKGWKPASGYSNGIVAAGPTIFVGGQVGWNAEQAFESDDLVEQTRQALVNIVAVLAEAGAAPEHVVRLTWYVTDKRDYAARRKEIGEAYRSVMGKHFPTMTLVEVSGLLEDRARVEIEAMAVLSGS
jgi:enamine deaminase RidA (YjgF/YER057c/UK114 family)